MTNESLYDLINRMQPTEAQQYAASVVERYKNEWAYRRRPDQTPPFDTHWDVWIYSGGRGAGKTRTGAEETNAFARANPGSRLVLVARTAADVREVLVEGESGILQAADRTFTSVHYKPSIRQLEWSNGAKAFVTNADEPDSIRGVEAHFAWADEVAYWRMPKKKKREKGATDAWENLRLAVRLPANTYKRSGRIIVTTTPKKTKMLKKLHEEILADPLGVRLTQASSYDNRTNLAESYLKTISDMYAGTELEKTEIKGLWPWKY